MKAVPFLFGAVLMLLVNIVYAKGGCGGHGGGGHGCGHVGGAVGAHGSSNTDVFKDLRTKICSGYIVYNTDTLSGIIVCVDNKVCLKDPQGPDSTHTYMLKDTALSAVMLYENNQSLYLTRLGDKKLYRVFHTGKLSIYDTYYSFDYRSKEFFNNHSKIVYGSRIPQLRGAGTLSTKRKLVSEINNVYGLDLKAKSYSKRALLDYVAKLN